MKYFDDNSLSIGNTPLVKLNSVVNSNRTLVLAKIEGRNPAYSVKCRIGVDNQDPNQDWYVTENFNVHGHQLGYDPVI